MRGSIHDGSETADKAIAMEAMPKYDLFLSQVIDFLTDCFPGENFTRNIIQNYIKSEVISKPFHGRKRGYTRMHLIQLVLLCYMRPVLTSDEIKKVFSLAFNDINNSEDDIITWENAYSIFTRIYEDNTLSGRGEDEDRIRPYLQNLKLSEMDMERIKSFISVLILIATSSSIKRKVRGILEKA